MHIHKPYLPKLLVVAAAAASFGLGAASAAASATTEPPAEPTRRCTTAVPATQRPSQHTMDTRPVLAVDG